MSAMNIPFLDRVPGRRSRRHRFHFGSPPLPNLPRKNQTTTRAKLLFPKIRSNLKNPFIQPTERKPSHLFDFARPPSRGPRTARPEEKFDNFKSARAHAPVYSPVRIEFHLNHTPACFGHD
jgi:hypothetical protein